MAPVDSTELLQRLVAFDTTSCNSNLALIDFVERYLADLGVSSRRVFDETGQKANLWATVGKDGPGGVVLSGHTDTVPVEGQSWTSDPFTLTPRDGRLYGRGSCDMKGFIACVLAAVPRMQAAPLARPIHLAFSYDEEVGCVGVARLLEVLQTEGVKPACCIVGEPTLMQVVTGHKAKRSMRVDVRGKACHSSLAPEGVNAVDFAALVVVRMRQIAERLAHDGGRDEAYDVAYSTAHTGTMHGGTALNIVPDECSMQCEFRVLPGEDADALVAELQAYIDELDAEMKRHDPQCGIVLDVYAGFPGLETDPEAEVTVLAKRLARTNGHSKVAYGTEAGRFHEMLATPTIVCGPGSIGQAHKGDEYIDAAQIAACDAFLDRLIGELSA